jgi:hypothetical protein
MNELKSLNAEWILIVFVMQWKINTRVLFTDRLYCHLFSIFEIVSVHWADWWMKLKNLNAKMDSKRVLCVRWVINTRVLFTESALLVILFRFFVEIVFLRSEPIDEWTKV